MDMYYVGFSDKSASLFCNKTNRKTSIRITITSITTIQVCKRVKWIYYYCKYYNLKAFIMDKTEENVGQTTKAEENSDSDNNNNITRHISYGAAHLN